MYSVELYLLNKIKERLHIRLQRSRMGSLRSVCLVQIQNDAQSNDGVVFIIGVEKVHAKLEKIRSKWSQDLGGGYAIEDLQEDCESARFCQDFSRAQSDSIH
jgi:hypothetical protein